MNKSVKIVLIIVGILFAILMIDTIQAKTLDNSPFLKLVEDYNGGNLYQKNKGILVDNYIFTDGNKVTVFKWEKYTPQEAKKRESEEQENENKEQENQNVEYKKYSKVIDDTTIELDIPSKWNYEEVIPAEEDDFKYALKLYKNSADKNVTLYYYNNFFGVCGTGRMSEEIKLNNGTEVFVGYYDGDREWLDIALSRNIAFINHGLDEEDSNEALEFIKTINITTSET